jgi:hypothetical protein
MILGMTSSALLADGALTSQGNSTTAAFIAYKHWDGRSQLQKSQVLGLSGGAVLYDLYQVYKECLKPNWDGYDALPVTEIAYNLARQFIVALPLGTPPPSLGADPDGEITVEWHHSPRRTLSVSVNPDGKLDYAALLGTSRVYGTEVFYGEVPKKIVDLIYEVFPRGR